jgi:formylglycine-generating enzyme required for sulfatase activity
MRFITLVLLSTFFILFFLGCGEDEQSPLEVVSKAEKLIPPSGSTTGAIEIPSDSKIKPDEMKILVGGQEITPFATGEFFVPEPEIPQMLIALNPDGKVRYFGYVLPAVIQGAPSRKNKIQINTQTSIGPESTAIELVFLSSMLHALPTELYYEALEMVKDEPAVKTLAGVLDLELKMNPYLGLEDILPNVKTEFTKAVSAINDRIMSYAGNLAPPLNISPAQRQSGCEITRNSQDSEGLIQIKNYYNRYVFVIAHKQGSTQKLTDKFVGMGKPAISIYTLVNFFKRNFDTVPAEETMTLPLTAQKDTLQVEVVGFALGASKESQWTMEYYMASGATVGMVYIIPIIKHILGSSVESAFDKGFTASDVFELFALESYNVIKTRTALKEAYNKGNIGYIVWETASGLWGSKTFQQIMIKQFGISVFAGVFEKALPVLKVAGIIVEGLNAGYATSQLAIAEPQVTFNAIETETIVRITEPANNTSTQQNTIHVIGKVENTDATKVQIMVNDKEQQQANILYGSFDATITLTDGNNIIKVSVDGVIAQVNITKIKQTVGGKEIIGKDGALMVLIPAGEFQMGDSFNEGDSDERPVHTVYLDAFYIDKYEVTNAQYKKFMDATGYKAPYYWNDSTWNAPNNPVVGVSWYDSKAYADWAGERLPTEAEWEKSARGGLVGKRYPWGDNITHDDANYWEKGGKDIWSYTSPVGSFAPNGYGLYDMAGNVWEWCADWWGSNYYATSPKSNPKGPDSGDYKVFRGGSWYLSSYLRTASRNYFDPTYAHYGLSIGFRCVQ